MSTDAIERAAAAVAAESTVRGLLATTCRVLVELLDASACAVSRVIGDLLVGLDEHTNATRPLQFGHEYLISDYPLTREVIECGEPRRVSRSDANAEPAETALLEKLGFESLLMVCLPAGGACWGLVEVYSTEGRFDERQAEVAMQLAARAGERLRQLERA